ncbi:ABC transporter ATP-binding protein [Aestuariispira insulae]|uniref:ABC-2 type transport system ATP-binding protein n=1 Tax=Aestuariispira insulae TaxID=1461337 RepID=A0A3D9H5F4_9PROT|nr:ABC transporter ATP-binding protein [Aestuariispira insulae]RED44186.1 ABC-2 type transport system ATP-binding protein [Aestuariispira insulae]
MTQSRRTVLEAENLAKHFGKTAAVNDVSLSTKEGEILAILGPNGAGKTTLTELLTGLRQPDKGTVRVLGDPPSSMRARNRIGLTPQNVALPKTLKVKELLPYVAAHFDTPLPVDLAKSWFLLDGLMDRNAGDLSGGQMRRVALAAAFMGQPKLAFLDEPTTGLDIQAKRALWKSIRAAAHRNVQITLTTHDLDEVQELADRVIVINRGRILLEDSPDRVRRRLGHRRLSFRSAPVNGDAPFPGAVQEAGRWVVDVADGDQAVRDLVRSGVAFEDLELAPASLEDAILAELERSEQADKGTVS